MAGTCRKCSGPTTDTRQRSEAGICFNCEHGLSREEIDVATLPCGNVMFTVIIDGSEINDRLLNEDAVKLLTQALENAGFTSAEVQRVA